MISTADIIADGVSRFFEAGLFLFVVYAVYATLLDLRDIMQGPARRAK